MLKTKLVGKKKKAKLVATDSSADGVSASFPRWCCGCTREQGGSGFRVSGTTDVAVSAQGDPIS